MGNFHSESIMWEETPFCLDVPMVFLVAPGIRSALVKDRRALMVDGAEPVHPVTMEKAQACSTEIRKRFDQCVRQAGKDNIAEALWLLEITSGWRGIRGLGMRFAAD